MKTTQEILNCAISHMYDRNTMYYMCYAIENTFPLSSFEKYRAQRKIRKYIHELCPNIECMTLRKALAWRDLPFHFDDRLAIYKDWENRPRFNKQNTLMQRFMNFMIL